MKGLLIKDFKLLKNQKTLFAVICFISFILLLTGTEPSFIISYVTFVVAMFALSSVSYDEDNNGYAFLFSLPITRRQYVSAKYLFGLLVGAGAWILSTVLITVYTWVKYPGKNMEEWFFTVMLYLAILLLFLFVIFPVELKFGAEKGKVAMFCVVGGIFAGGFLLSKVIHYIGIDMERLWSGLVKMNTYLLFGMIFLVCGIVGVISYTISLGIMKRKEF